MVQSLFARIDSADLALANLAGGSGPEADAADRVAALETKVDEIGRRVAAMDQPMTQWPPAGALSYVGAVENAAGAGVPDLQRQTFAGTQRRWHRGI